eukprot:1009892-Karenia_brevis.AAC.1
MSPGCVSGAVWEHFLVRARKWVQEASLEFFRAFFWPGIGNGSRIFVWSSPRPFFGLGSEINSGGLFGAS